jgi:hypothetical protein
MFIKAALLAVLPVVSAHFHLNYPYWRGDSLALTATNASITQWNYPCKFAKAQLSMLQNTNSFL